MSVLMQIPLSIQWLRMANKYIEHLYSYSIDRWVNTVRVEKKAPDEHFEDEFDYIIREMGF